MKILLLGRGAIGGALEKAWSQQHDLVALDSSSTPPAESWTPDVVVVAVKPQNMAQVGPLLARWNGTPMISVLAGVTMKRLNQCVKTPWVRIMPNLALQTGLSMNLCFTDDPAQKALTNDLFGDIGQNVWFPKEDWLETLTPITGCGPAFFFAMAQVMVQIVSNMGFSQEQATELVQQIFVGSASLAVDAYNFKGLIQSVASQGGVTEAALEVLQPTLSKIMVESVLTANKRLKELQRAS